MNIHQQKGEIWEVQFWLLCILAILLNQFGHPTLFIIVIIWAVATFIGIFGQVLKGKALEDNKS